MRFRTAPAERGLGAAPFDEVTGQLRAKAVWVKAVRVKTGTLVDATVRAPARVRCRPWWARCSPTAPVAGRTSRRCGREAGLQVRPTAMACSLRRTMTILQDRCA